MSVPRSAVDGRSSPTHAVDAIETPINEMKTVLRNQMRSDPFRKIDNRAKRYCGLRTKTSDRLLAIGVSANIG